LAIGGNLIMYLGDKFAMNFKAMAGKAVYPNHVDSIVRFSRVIPGIGYAYRSNNDSINPQYAYQYFSGYVSFSPNKYSISNWGRINIFGVMAIALYFYRMLQHLILF